MTVPPSSTAYDTGQTYQVPPAELVLERNIRLDAKADAELVDSIAQVGVLEPIVAVLDDQGRLVVRFGHRRAIAAVEAGRATVPVYVSAGADVSREGELARLREQYDENTARAGLSAADTVNMVDQLMAFGLSSAEIAEGYRLNADRIAQAVAIRDSKLASKAAARPTFSEVTLEHLATVADFDDDPDVASKLLAVAKERPDQFAHVVSRERDDRERERVRAELAAELAAKDVTVITRDDGRLPEGCQPLYRLAPEPGAATYTERTHRKCPGHAAFIAVEITLVEGRREPTATPSWVCTNWKACGHFDTYASTSSTAAADKTDAEREADAKKRRLVVENNKAWDAATPVRREWIAALAARKTAPKGWATFVVGTLSGDYARGPRLLGEAAGHHIGHSDLGLPATVDVDKDGPLATLCWVLAAYEAGLTRDSWRENGKYSIAGRYFNFLDSIGYPLSEVEIYAASSRTA